MRGMLCVVFVLGSLAGTASADDVFEVCKGESKTAVAGTGKPSIGVVYPDSFPIKTTPAMRNAVGARLARAEKATIVPAKDVVAAKTLVEARQWSKTSAACSVSASLVAVLGIRHTNLISATAEVVCDPAGACQLQVDLERHGRKSAERWVRYVAPLKGPKTELATYMAAAPKLTLGPKPDKVTPGMAVKELPANAVTVRSTAAGYLEVDRTMEASQAFPACRPKTGKKATRGFWAEWTLLAPGKASSVMVKPFAGVDPLDKEAAACLQRAIEQTQFACPRDGKQTSVKSAICL